MSISVGDKYIIEVGAIAELPDGKKKYFIKPFESLVFDRKGLEQLERYDKVLEKALTESQVIKEFENLYIYQNDYQDFLNTYTLFNDENVTLFDVVAKFGINKVVIDFIAWQAKQKANFNVGDICIYDGNTEDAFLITNIYDSKFFDGILYDGTPIIDGSLSLIKKIGHTDKIKQILDELKETL